MAADRGRARLVRPADPGAGASRWSRQVLAGGWRPFVAALATPEVRRAFGLTLGITALATVDQHGLRRGIRPGAGAATILGPGAGRRPGGLAVRRLAGGRRVDADHPLRAGRLARAVDRGRGIRVVYAVPGMVLAMHVRDPAVRRPRGGAGAARVGRRPGGGGLYARRRPLADILARDAALDPLGRGLRRDPDGRPVARRVRRPAGRLGQPHRPDPDGHALHPRRDRELPPGRGLRGEPGAGGRLVRPAGRHGRIRSRLAVREGVER